MTKNGCYTACRNATSIQPPYPRIDHGGIKELLKFSARKEGKENFIEFFLRKPD